VTGRPPDRLTATTDALAERLGGFRPRVAIVLGSGLGALTKAVRAPQRIPFTSLPEFPETGVHGHAGELVAGELEGVPVVLQSGRFHLYEGHAPGIVALPVRVFAELGAAVLIVTNAA
ncbi:MAG: purine-nucleoside phosphorylase, partial [Gemmatimonadales bacterium]|nr:purine-nucleoside phosphorylase [Gemmatimonadales bacterium]NIN10785.1 purine-nucleoside phosphorylase [Gemmatimonadales bacterium]NIN48931.1 purine-nucleoside phosphorylase [Gemmatimonadales bacterium]NIP06395.1 purine-nucleoside phosphorylase [Gemmatimonadales bacterium]NIR00206.1 purine-nucleoside phosphorylase [Gemmatimonadales bacterium]